jgi:hypothetical protein
VAPPPINQPPGQQFDYSQYTGESSQAVAQTSYGMKDGTGGSDIFIPEVIAGFPQFEPKAGTVVVFDIVMAPAGSKHPMVVNGRIKPEAPVHVCWAYVHKSLGLNQGWFICPSRTYGKRCPACEERARIMASPNLSDEQVSTRIKPYASGKGPLGIYNVLVHSNPQAMTWAEPVMWWPITFAYMEAVLQGKSKSDAVMEGTGVINYFWPTAGPQGGRHIKVDVIQEGKYNKFTGHTFYQRQQPIPPHVMQQARALSEFLYIGADWDSYYDEIKQAVDIVVESQGTDGVSQPTGMDSVGYGAGPRPPGSEVFGTPPPQQGLFPECEPFGTRHGDFEECNGCTVKVQCYNSAPAGRQEALPAPGMAPGPAAVAPPPVVAPVNVAPPPGPPNPGTPAVGTTPPGAPIPRRNVT